MSWQAYVDSNLVGTKFVTQAAIFGHDGGKWAASAGFARKNFGQWEQVSLTSG